MPLFQSGNFKYLIDFFKGYILSFRSSFRIFNAHVVNKSKVSFFTFVLGCSFWMAIFIPSTVHSFSFYVVKEGFKSSQGFHVLDYCSVEKFINSIGCSSSPYSDIVSQIQNFTHKSVSELGCGFVEFFPSSPAFTEKMGKPSSKEGSSNTKQKPDKSWDDLDHFDHLGYLSLLISILFV